MPPCSLQHSTSTTQIQSDNSVKGLFGLHSRLCVGSRPQHGSVRQENICEEQRGFGGYAHECAHTYTPTRPWKWLASLTIKQHGACFYLFTGVFLGLLPTHGWPGPTGNAPAIPDGNLQLTTNLLNLHICVN